ncbi:hypothetical protein IJF89_00690 [Candidatus Saccharibacteria bacterium]|nr:hypothetical protein [Candidatus Saccharibacteria bacterium]
MKNVALFGLTHFNEDYTVKDNRTGKETNILDAKELEQYARDEQKNQDDKPKDLWQRISPF